MKRSLLVLSIVVLGTHAFAAKKAKAVENEQSSEITSAVHFESAKTSVVRLQPTLGMSSFRFNFEGTGSKESDKLSENTTGIAAGGVVEFGRGSFVGQTGLMFVQTGYEAQDDGVTLVGTVDYLAIPAIAKFNLSGNPQGSFFLKGGAMPMIFTGGKMTAKYQGQKFTETIKSDDIHTFDTAAVLGGGFSFAMTASTSGVVDLTYNRGLFNLIKNGEGTRAYNEGFILSFAASIGL